MAVEWIANGVRVNAVSPGTIFSQTASDNYAIDVFQMAIPHIPAKRLGKGPFLYYVRVFLAFYRPPTPMSLRNIKMAPYQTYDIRENE